MQIRSAKELIVYQKAYQLAMAGDRDQKSEDRRQCQVPEPLPDLRPLISDL
jgi:hypothetical protein